MSKRPHLIPCLIIAIMLFLAITNLPYGYYQLLRWLTCGCSIFVAITAYRWKHFWATWMFSVLAILFNPIFIIALTKGIWHPIDIVSGILFCVIAITLKSPESEEKTSESDKPKSS